MRNIGLDQKNIRKYHYFMLLSLIQKHKAISRTQLADLTQMSTTSVGKIVKTLIEDELVVEVGQVEGEVGRRATLLQINANGAYIIGAQIDTDDIQLACVSLNGSVIEKRTKKWDANKTPLEILDLVVSEIKSLIANLADDISEKIIAVGISLPGLISWPDGELLMAPQFNWKNVPIRSYLEEKIQYDVYVDNHVRTILLAENYFGSLENANDVVCIHIGSGAGSSVMVNGEILRGANNTLGEIGHITLDPNGALCGCGRFGCLQTFICSAELEKQTQKPIAEIKIAFDQGEDWAVKLIERARNYLALAISNIVCMYSPKQVLLTGPMIQKFQFLTENIDELVHTQAWNPLEDSFEIHIGNIGKDSGVIGASALVLNEFLRYRIR